MKLKTSSITLLAASWLLSPIGASAQHAHLNAGATGQNQGDRLIFENGSIFEPGSGFVKSLVLAETGTYTGYYEGGITPTALATTAINGGPEPQASAPGSFIQMSIVKATGPVGGKFGFWESSAVAPTLSLFPGDKSDQLFPVSESDGSPGSDPFGHIHGRRLTATKPGVYTAWFQMFDTSANGVGGGGIHTPAEVLPIRFLAGTPTLLDQVPMGGAMAHVSIQYAEHDGGHFHIHGSATTPVLTPIAISQPDTQFDPTLPWFEDLDPSLNGMAFNRQYGFVVDPGSDPLPDGHAILIRQLSASPGLKVYTYRQDPATWEPMFGTDGSTDLFEWPMAMFHPAYAAPMDAQGPLTATYKAIMVDAQGEPTDISEEFTLTWDVAPGLMMAAPTIAGQGVEFSVTPPAAWAGYHYQLLRSGEFSDWTAVDEQEGTTPGEITLQDANPPADKAFYRVRPYLP